MRNLQLLTCALGLVAVLAACDDDDDAAPGAADAGKIVDAGPPAPDAGTPEALTPCLDRPEAPAAPKGALPCELLPPTR